MRFYYDDVNKITVENKENVDYIYFRNQRIDLKQADSFYTEPLDLAQRYMIEDAVGRHYLLEYRFITKTDWFLERYDARDEPLGALVKGDQTVFRLWAPSAHAVSLLVDGCRFTMERKDKGIFEYTFKENLHGSYYTYEVEVNGHINTTIDPYALASGLNQSASVVCDLSRFKDEITPLPALKKPRILELHVRDFTMDPNVGFKHKGKLLGLIESVGAYGFAHVQSMNINTVQVMPLHDFATVDERNPLASYNWGYDPMQYFALEGSYSSNPNDPFQVMRDLRTVIDTYHQNNLHVTLDVVFNHVYDVKHSSFHKTVPYYFFRYNQDGTLCNGSFCGNEFATEMPMARKLIVASCKFFTEFYQFDGFRFDLMGLMDRKTMEKIAAACPDAFLYGEGWQMECGLSEAERAHMGHADHLSRYSFFNDDIRDRIAGSLDGKTRGILGENESLSSLIDNLLGTKKLFKDPIQSINYIECHDNLTLADRLSKQNLTAQEALFLTQVMILASGVPLLQIGQSFYRDKKGVANSYRSSDAINHIPWALLDKNKVMHQKINRILDFKKYHHEIKEVIELDPYRLILDYGKNRVLVDKLNKKISLL